MLFGILSRIISVTTFPSQIKRMRRSLLTSIVTPIGMCCHSGSRAIISNSTMLSSRKPQRRPSDRTICAHPWEIPVQSLDFNAKKTQRESPMAVITKMRESHNNPQLEGEWSLTRFCRRIHCPSTRPCGQRRARSGRLRSHGHRAPSLPSVSWPLQIGQTIR